jgi:GT2 family glycosyltransferase
LGCPIQDWWSRRSGRADEKRSRNDDMYHSHRARDMTNATMSAARRRGQAAMLDQLDAVTPALRPLEPTANGPKKLAVVIINFRTPDLVASCLDSLLGELDAADHAVVVVDNASCDGSAAKLEQRIAANATHALVRLICSERNLGFSGGNNVGLRAIDADYYLLLNSDTIVRHGAIAALLKAAESYPNAGIISPRLEWPDGTPQESCFRFPTPLSEFIAAAQTGPVTSLLKRFDVPLAVRDTIARPAWTSFACVLLRKEMLEVIGLMDEGFFLYFEDVEFCRRARAAGWEIVHDPAARVVHLRGGTSPVKRLAAQQKPLPRYYYESRSRFFYVAYGHLGLTLANTLWWLGRCISKGRELIGHRQPSLPKRQWRDIWTNWLVPSRPSSRPTC